ncbi:MAG: glycosyltransferase family 2 protein [Desulfovibrionaceae bacterium]
MAHYTHIAPGLTHELAHLSLDEVVTHLKNYISHFLLEPATISLYINRIANDPGVGTHVDYCSWLLYLTRKFLQLEPFDITALSLLQSVADAPEEKQRLDVLQKVNSDPKAMAAIDRDILNGQDDDARIRLLELLRRYPHHIAAAALLLRQDARTRAPIDDWLPAFNCPSPFKPHWRTCLFIHHASQNKVDEAMALWRDIDPALHNETLCNLAAEIMVKAGDRRRAVALYMQSLKLAPWQNPVRRRLDELASPFVPNPNLATEKKVRICLYSWNKADMLGKTLASLRQTDIGNAGISVLLNGCTDHSLDVARQAQAMFGERDFSIIQLPVNVGAPAARNWLIATDQVRQADYAAFLDDDVDVQPDWLHHFLTVAESAQNPGVVGCKVVNPGTPTTIQYLYRNIAVARPDLLRLSFAKPGNVCDTNHYDFIRPTDSVMGCCHLLSRKLLDAHPTFDLRYSPTQMDDIAHDLDARLSGFPVHYTGLVRCVHHQNSGALAKINADMGANGNMFGNDLKFFYSFIGHIDALRQMRDQGIKDAGLAA